MKTAIRGRVRLKLFWGSVYSNPHQIIRTVCRMGKLVLVLVVYPCEEPFSRDYYKSDVMEMLKRVYDVRWENVSLGDDDDEMWHYVYSRIDEGLVGRPEFAYKLLQKGISCVQKADKSHGVCSIGFNENEQKWYGWSHRSMYGFGIGDIVEEGDCCASSGWTEEYLSDHPEEDKRLPVGFRAENLKDAERMATAFAESVS